MQQEIQKHIQTVCEQLFNQSVEVTLTIPEERFGDLTTNVAMRLAKEQGSNPRTIAQQIVDALEHEAIKSAAVAGPGFINITLADAALTKSIQFEPSLKQEMRVVIETNNSNAFKAMHIGHAYNAILADTIANIIEVSGAETHRVSYHGDVGLHVGRSMYSILRYIDGDIKKLDEIPKNERNTFLSRMYVEGSKAHKEDEAAKRKIDELTKLSFNPPEGLYKDVYETCRAWSFAQIDQITKQLGNRPIERRYPESETDKLGLKTVKQHVGDVFIESNGAVIFPGKQYGAFDNAFVTSEGNSLYGARDLGLMQLKHRDFQPQKSYIVTAEEQRAYFIGVIKAAELCLPELDGVTVNIPTGTVKLSSGKMSSREGDVVEIEWLFERLAETIKDKDGAIDDEIVQAALRYEFLKVRSGSDVVFDIEESVSLHGNSGVYLQYALVRANSILRKAAVSTERPDYPGDLEPTERSLVRKLSHYSSVLDAATETLQPHLICTYLYELCKEFNRFYEENTVIGSNREKQRISMVWHYQAVLQRGLALLGIPAIDKM